jgi:putative FmdB family regulatory protein
MPVYEYSCPICARVIELERPIHHDGVERCPECNRPMDRIISLSTFHLAGDGWPGKDGRQ